MPTWFLVCMGALVGGILGLIIFTFFFGRRFK